MSRSPLHPARSSHQWRLPYYDVYRLLRDHAPVYYNERRNLWVTSRYCPSLWAAFG
jgi:hypothetical protein